MNGNEYQKLAMVTNDGKCTTRLIDAVGKFGLPFNDFCCDIGDVINACLGLAGEAGEVNDMVKKWIFHEKPLDEEHLKKECGDVLWYCALLCHAFDWNLDEIMQMNIDKLKNRYPKGFDINKANNRKDDDV